MTANDSKLKEKIKAKQKTQIIIDQTNLIHPSTHQKHILSANYG